MYVQPNLLNICYCGSKTCVECSLKPKAARHRVVFNIICTICSKVSLHVDLFVTNFVIPPRSVDEPHPSVWIKHLSTGKPLKIPG